MDVRISADSINASRQIRGFSRPSVLGPSLRALTLTSTLGVRGRLQPGEGVGDNGLVGREDVEAGANQAVQRDHPGPR